MDTYGILSLHASIAYGSGTELGNLFSATPDRIAFSNAESQDMSGSSQTMSLVALWCNVLTAGQPCMRPRFRLRLLLCAEHSHFWRGYINDNQS
jgi:hypothetical protein